MAKASQRRVALVTGGARRVGRAIVRRLIEADFDVAFTFAHSADDAAELANEFADRTLALRADLTKPEAACRAIAKKLARFSRLDLLVNNASIYEPGDGRLKEMLAVHLEAPLLLCRAFAPLLTASRGHVINMIDLLAERPMPRFAAYCATKAALSNLTLSLARELAPAVTVNGISPGVVAWPADLSAADRRAYLKRVPLGHAGTPQDVAELVHFLVSKGTYITGQILRVDGGRSIV